MVAPDGCGSLPATSRVALNTERATRTQSFGTVRGESKRPSGQTRLGTDSRRAQLVTLRGTR